MPLCYLQATIETSIKLDRSESLGEGAGSGEGGPRGGPPEAQVEMAASGASSAGSLTEGAGSGLVATQAKETAPKAAGTGGGSKKRSEVGLHCHHPASPH